MTSEAKKALSTTIRDLRDRLLEDLKASAESTYRFSMRVGAAGLSERVRAQRERLETWIEEQQRADVAPGKNGQSEEFYRRAVEKQAAYTLLNRLVVLRRMEALGLRAPAVVTGGWESRGYKDFRSLAPALVRDDESEGYAFLLQLVFEDLALELPGIFGPPGIAELVPVPAATLRHAVEALDREELATCWEDELTLGWVYQYWNDPEREALDDKLKDGGKIEPHEIASKTQMFTERYMVDWLLQNSLGPMWLAMCRKNGWVPEVEADGTLDRLEARRAEWREKRAQGKVELTELMPLQSDAERRWAYYVPQPVPDDAVAAAPDSVRDLKILDPAVGSGHFLVVALDMLVALYREEARHRREEGHRWSDRGIVEHIWSNNLFGIDLDPRAVQLAAATLWLAGRQVAADARMSRLNLVASNLRLASLPDNDPALVELRTEVERETGMPGALTDQVLHALRGADHLGSLLKVDSAVEEALNQHELQFRRVVPQSQGGLFTGFAREPVTVPIEREEARATLLDRLEGFLARHTSADDLGLRLRGEQLAAGVRFVRTVRAGAYHLVVANPPYQGSSGLTATEYLTKVYPLGKADLYAAFLLRGLELVRRSGVPAMLTMRNWMFIKQYSALRKHLLETYDLRALGDFAVGAFDEVPNDLLSVVVSVFRRASPGQIGSVARQPTSPGDTSYDRRRTARKRAATLCHEGRHAFAPAALKVILEWPLIYWWSADEIEAYRKQPKFGSLFDVKQGLCTGDNVRFLRFAFELPVSGVIRTGGRVALHSKGAWVPFMKGGENRRWFEPLVLAINWQLGGLEIKVGHEAGVLAARPQNERFYMRRGVAVQTTGATFSARIHRFPSIFGDKARSVFPDNLYSVVYALNSREVRETVEALNPTIDFTVGDLKRVPFAGLSEAELVMPVLEVAFDQHERTREPSVEFSGPGPSYWDSAQAWGQAVVDRPKPDPVPDYVVEPRQPPSSAHLSFAVGVLLGRFGQKGEGALDPATANLSGALPHGVLFLDGTLDAADMRDSLGHPAAAPLHAAWAVHGASSGVKGSLRGWLAVDFFREVHRLMYESRPIHWPLSSRDRTFVAWVNIHRITDRTLSVLLADHLAPTRKRLTGAIEDLGSARDGNDKAAARDAERALPGLQRALKELDDFMEVVEACTDRGPPTTDPACPAREQDARYAPDLADGVMINSAALWPLLEPQWKDPKKWWKELATAKGRKDYDWSHLAMRYWPTRVDDKCKTDPSLGVAHGCFWRYHPARAWAWELRLQDEIGPEFRITEPPYRPGGRDLGDEGDAPHRAAYLRDHPQEAIAAVEKEAVRRMGRGNKRKVVPEVRLLESGLWSRYARAMWDAELSLSEKQGAELRILAPDEPEARAALASAHPELVRERAARLSELVTPVLFDEPDEEEVADEQDDVDPEEDE